MQKRGISEIVTWIIGIGIVLVLIAVFWAMFLNFTKEKSSDVDIGRITVSLNIVEQSVKLDLPLIEGEKPKITLDIRRNQGEGKIKGVRIVLSDGGNSESQDWIGDIEEFEVQNVLNGYELQEISCVKTVSVAPIFESASGNDEIGNFLDEYQFSEGACQAKTCINDLDCEDNIE